MSEMEDAGTRSTGKSPGMQTLPPKRGQVKMRVLKSLLKSATAFTSLTAGGGRKNADGNGPDDGASLPLSSPSTSGYNSDD